VPASEQSACQILTSYGDFDFPGMRVWYRRRYFNGEAALSRILEIAEQLLHRIALGGAAGNTRHFSPVTTFFSFVNYCAQFHWLSLHGANGLFS
ncbi:MAG: hypothetical protein ACRD2L_12910, partial [Terriglobia bacterium]